MACNDAKGEGSLLPESVNIPIAQTNIKAPPKNVRHWRCRSAPLSASATMEIESSTPTSKSFLGKVHQKVHPSFRQVTLFLALYLGVGTVSFYLLRHQIKGTKTNGLLDSVYFCIVTMSTVGYGDLVPDSVPTKLLACAYVFAGMAMAGLVLSKAADYLIEKQEIFLLKALHKHQKVGPIEFRKEVKSTHGVRNKCILIFILLLVLNLIGTVFIATVEKLNFVDAFYCVCSTMTTLGYGDESFKTKGGRIFAVFWIFTSTISVAQFFLKLAELTAESRQRKFVKSVLSRKATRVDLVAADLDGDGVVDAAEFVIYKLKEMGKISQEDISLVMKEFGDLDVDQSGTLSGSDIVLVQLSQPQR